MKAKNHKLSYDDRVNLWIDVFNELNDFALKMYECEFREEREALEKVKKERGIEND